MKIGIGISVGAYVVCHDQLQISTFFYGNNNHHVRYYILIIQNMKSLHLSVLLHDNLLSYTPIELTTIQQNTQTQHRTQGNTIVVNQEKKKPKW